MLIMHKFIFFKVYHFYVNFFGEKDIPHFFASAVLSILVYGVGLSILMLLQFLFGNDVFDELSNYWTYIATFGMFFLIYKLHKREKYKDILIEVNALDVKVKNRLTVLSILYSFSVVAGCIVLLGLVRNLNSNI